jgi:hypothetical protein
MRGATANCFVSFSFTECNKVRAVEHKLFSDMEISNGKMEYLYKKWLNINRIIVQTNTRVSTKTNKF